MSARKQEKESTPSNGSDELPEGWARCRIADVTARVPNYKPSDEPKREFQYIDISSIDNVQHRVTGYQSFLGNAAPSRARRPVQTGDVIFSNVRTYLRNIAQVTDEISADLCSTGFTVMRSNGAVLPGFLFRYAMTDQFVDPLTEKQTGSSYPAVTDRIVLASDIPLPPLAEQKRIVAKVEALLERVNKARERLDRVPEILKRFRQSVLAAACSGRLTADWREENHCSTSAAELMENILRLRKKRYLEDCHTAESKGRRKPRAPTNLVRQSVVSTELFALPSDWEWVTWNDLADWVTYGFTRKMPHVPSGVPIVTAKNVRDGFIDFDQLSYTTVEAFEALSAKDKPRKFEVLMTKDGAIRGRAAVVETDEPFCISQSVAVIRFGGLSADAHFLLRVIQSRFTQHLIEIESEGTAIPHISITNFGELPVPLPPLQEQSEIVRRVSALFDLATLIAERLASAKQRVETIAQSILAKAFAGELVETEADLARREGRDYEPASVLLERIAAEREARTAKPSKSRRKRVAKRKKGSAPRPLLEVITESKDGLSPEQLAQYAGFDEQSIEAFYRELRDAVKVGVIVEERLDDTRIRLTAGTP